MKFHFYEDISANNFIEHRTDFDTLWLPAYMYAIVYDTIHSGDYFYEYHENGLLKRFNFYDNFKGELLCYSSYNNTYRDPEMDILDTLFYYAYTDDTGHHYPQRRWYYNNRQADSSYWEEYYQIWDGEKWNTEERSYVHLLDTLTVSEFQDIVEIYDKNGNIKESRKTVLTFDDKGNVKEAVSDCFDLYNGQYRLKFLYRYDKDGICYQRNSFFDTSGAWHYSAKLANIKWFEYHGFNNGDLLFHGAPQGLYHLYSPKNKNKMSSLKYWDANNLLTVDTVKWNLYPLSSYYFTYMAYNMCLSFVQYYEYNNRFHLTSDGRLYYEVWNCDTVYEYRKDYYTNKYDERGRRYEYSWTNTYFPVEDTLFEVKWTYIVDSFTYVLRPVGIKELPAGNHTLLIVPNPSGETVRITAADEIADVSFYASDGRITYSRNGTGKEMNVNIQGMAAGVYVVQARLKNGGVQTGKVVVR